MENKFILGLENVHIAFRNDTDDGWKTPVKLEGATRFAPSPVGEAQDFYADNGVYFTFQHNAGYTAELENFNFPNEVLAEMFGWETDDNGALIESQNNQPKPFALMAEVEGHKKDVRFVYYNCIANRFSKESITRGESADVSGISLPMMVRPIVIGARKVVKGTMELSDTNATAFNSFFTSVYEPTFA